MAGKGVVSFSFIGDATSTIRAIDAMEAKVSSFAGTIGGLDRAMLKLGERFAIFEVFKKTSDGLKESEAATARLGAAMFAAGEVAGGEFKTKLEEADAAGRKLGFSNDETTNALAKLRTAGVDTATGMKALTTVQDLARAKNISLEEATTAVTSAMQGNGRALRDLNITLPAAIAGTKSLESAQTALDTAQQAAAQHEQTRNEQQKQQAQSLADAEATAADRLAAVQDRVAASRGAADRALQATTDSINKALAAAQKADDKAGKADTKAQKKSDIDLAHLEKSATLEVKKAQDELTLAIKQHGDFSSQAAQKRENLTNVQQSTADKVASAQEKHDLDQQAREEAASQRADDLQAKQEAAAEAQQKAQEEHDRKAKSDDDTLAASQKSNAASVAKAKATFAAEEQRRAQEASKDQEALGKAQKNVSDITKDQADRTSHLGDVLDIVNGKVGGQAIGYADTYGGKLAVISANTKSASEQAANNFLPGINALLGPITAISEHGGAAAFALNAVALAFIALKAATAIGQLVGAASVALGVLTTWAWGTASGGAAAAAAFWALDGALGVLTSPITLIVAGVALLVGGIILLVTHLGAVKEALGWVKDRFGDAFGWVAAHAGDVGKWFEDLPGRIGGALANVGSVILEPFKWAFNEISKFWNSTMGTIDFHIPDWVPGVGGKGFKLPQLPVFHAGGVVPGYPGQEVPIMAMAGETVTPAGSSGASQTVHMTVMASPSPAEIADALTWAWRTRGV